MKKSKIIVILSFLIILLTSCNNQNINTTSNTDITPNTDITSYLEYEIIDDSETEYVKITCCPDIFAKKIIIPNETTINGKTYPIREIANKAFRYCSSLESITLPFIGESRDSNQYLGYIFGESSYGYNLSHVPSSLKEVIILEGCTTIGKGAFYKCSYLTSVVIPNSVTTIGSYAFEGCSSLKYNEYDNGLYLGNEDNPYLILVKAKDRSITSCIINENTRFIHSGAFYGCSSLTSVVIPNSVTSIGDYAFYGCGSLKYYNEYDDGLYLGNEDNPYLILVKAKDTSITSCIINENTRFIHSDAFSKCSFLTSIIIPNSVTTIGGYAFYKCSSLTIYCETNSQPSGWDRYWNYSNRPVYWGVSAEDIIEENGIQYLIINENAIITRYIGNETNIIIPSTIEVNGKTYSIDEIGDYAFYNCISLTTITIPSNLTTIGDYAFFRCSSLTTITIPNNTTTIGDYAFCGCSLLTNIVIPNSVTTIGDYAFFECSLLEMVIIPNNVTTIGDYTFFRCSSLTTITIPNNVTTIGDYAFCGCSSLTIYCEENTKQSGWSDNWNYSNRPVCWNYQVNN